MKTEVLNKIKFAESELVNHPIFSAIDSIQKLRIFMESHVFAVWDFMSLLKRLQKDLTCTSIPWINPVNSTAARLINEIVLAEESDVLPDGTFASHFSIYRSAMKEVGADTSKIDNFLHYLNSGEDIFSSLRKANVPTEARIFVTKTLNTSINSSLIEAAAWFFYGRESVIPNMFQSLLKSWKLDSKQAPFFVYYLDRHIHLDGEEHGPMANKVIDIILSENNISYSSVLQPALEAIKAREIFWDGLYKNLNSNYNKDLQL